MMKWHDAMPIAPMMRVGLRPQLSTYMTAGMVAMNMTMPTTPVARRETELLERPSLPKMTGA